MSLESTWVNSKLAAKEAIADLDAVVDVTYTAGSAPATDGALTIANSATPTVVELLAYIVELQAKVTAIASALQNE